MHDRKFPHLPPPSLPRKRKVPECSKFTQKSLRGGRVGGGGGAGANCIALGSPDVTSYTLQVDLNDDVVFQFAKFSKNFLVYSEKHPPPSLNPRQPWIKTC